MRRRARVGLLLARAPATAALAVLGAGAGCVGHAPQVHVVNIRNFVFEPATVAAAVGDTVVWKNTDIVPHSAKARDSLWDSRAIGTDSSWRFVAQGPGRHTYYCEFHPNMQGTVEVR